MLGTALGGLVVGALHLPVPDVPDLDPTLALALRPLSGTLLALVLAPVAVRLAVPTLARAGVLFLLLFGLNSLVNVIEGAFFTDWLGRGAAAMLLLAASGHLPAAWLLAVLFPPPGVESTLADAARHLFARRSAVAWLARLLAAGLAFVPIYWTFGMLVYPFVRSYYEDPALRLGLRVPAAEQILALQVGRGLLFVLLVLPLAVLLPGAWWRRGLWIGLVIAALVGWEPLLANTAWPLGLRVPHALEITADSLVHGLVITGLLVRPAPAAARERRSASPRVGGVEA
jgi:hypothetical protein